MYILHTMQNELYVLYSDNVTIKLLISKYTNFIFFIDCHQVMSVGGAKCMVPGTFQSFVRFSESIARGLMS